MKILWISGRSLDSDLAGTTELSICNSISKKGHIVELISPGKKINDVAFEHTIIKKMRIPGLNTISSSIDLKYLLRDMNKEQNNIDVILVDWRYVYFLHKSLEKFGVPWIIIDRGPPAYDGVLKKLQKWFWKKAWKISELKAIGGFVVSPAHKKLVEEFNEISMKIRIIPAGCTENGYLKNLKTDPNNLLKIIYIGRLDKRRGINSIINLAKNLDKETFNYKISIYGTGDFEKIIKRYSEHNKKITYYGTVNRIEIQRLLAGNHIGIMPMPDILVWNIASTLKLAEYMSAGLIIIGPKHEGNQINGEDIWNFLSPKEENWELDAVEQIKKYRNSKWLDITKSAVKDSKEYNWDNIAKILIDHMIDLKS